MCACFGAGLATACVVNVGDKISHVSCVEDGVSFQPTRVQLKFGGDHVTKALLWALKKVRGFGG